MFLHNYSKLATYPKKAVQNGLLAVTAFLLSRYSLFLADRSFLCPPRIRDICKPLLNAWLKSIRVWNSETKGNQARNATGVNRSRPITISYPRASVLIDPQNPADFTTGLHACAI